MLKKIILLTLTIIYIISIKTANDTINITKDKINNDNNIMLYLKKEQTDILGFIEINKIKLKRSIYNIDSKNNNLKNNIKTIMNSDNLLILASHSGNYRNAYFNDLNKLNINDEIIVNINNKETKYILNNKYDDIKDGNLDIYFNKNKNTLILITCNKKNKKYQTIYVSYKEEK